MNEFWQLGALELAAWIRRGDTVDPHLNAVVRRLDDDAPVVEHGTDTRDGATELVLDDTIRSVLPGNVLGIPAVAVQVYGDRFTDLRWLAVAEQIQSAEGLHTPIDPVKG